MHTQTSQARPLTPAPVAARVAPRAEPTPLPSGRLEFRRAAKAIRALLADPNATDQVFIILEALGGRILQRAARDMRRDPVGRRLLASPPDLVARLLDREQLRTFGANTLAHRYLGFVEAEGISADGLMAADVRRPLSGSDEAFVQAWLRDTHDLKHALTGYHGDLIGEAALLAFDLAQHPSLGLALIVLAGYTRFSAIPATLEPNARRIVRQGFLRGLRARTLIHVDYTEALGRDLDELRDELRLGPEPRYRPVRAHEVSLAAPR
jgi:ubiquinone biosynthesis protein COQ4